MPDTESPSEPIPDDTSSATEVPAAEPPVLGPAACAARLAELFPALFAPDVAKPIKLRIHVDIQARAPGQFTRKSLSPFLHRYTTSNAYLKALALATHRFDLDGAPAGELADEHRQAAIAELDRRRALHEARRAEQRRAQRADERSRAPRAGAPVPVEGTARRSAHHGAHDRAPDSAQDSAQDSAHSGAQNGTPSGARHPAPDGARDRRQDRPRAHASGSKRPAQPPRPARQGPPPSRSRPPSVSRAPAHEQPLPRPASRPPPAAPMDEAARERLALLRAWESTALTKANFCALKRMSEVQLDELLTQARRERGDRPAPEPASRRR